MLKALQCFLTEEKGQGLAEYGLILALVALAVVTALTTLGGGLDSIFARINQQLNGAVPATTSSTTSS